MDSFAYRRPDLMASVDVFEVDHPASQAWKRARVADLGIAAPARLHHVAVDFERQTLAEGLAESAVDLGKPAFLAWLGVTQYLAKDAVLRTLCDVAATVASDSELVVQFIVPPATMARGEVAPISGQAERARILGEPWLSFFEPAEMERHCRDAGFAEIEHFGFKEATERYFQGRSDGLRPPGHFCMIKARTI